MLRKQYCLGVNAQKHIKLINFGISSRVIELLLHLHIAQNSSKQVKSYQDMDSMSEQFELTVDHFDKTG
jgi:hypothetical protein